MVRRKDVKQSFNLPVEADAARDHALRWNSRFALMSVRRFLFPASFSLVSLIVNACGGATIIGPGSSPVTPGTPSNTSHEVDLQWNAPVNSSVPVVGYLVHRTNSGVLEYQQLNTYVVTSTTFVDQSVVSGKSYDYVVLSVDASGNTSSPSNTATAVIP